MKKLNGPRGPKGQAGLEWQKGPIAKSPRPNPTKAFGNREPLEEGPLAELWTSGDFGCISQANQQIREEGIPVAISIEDKNWKEKAKQILKRGDTPHIVLLKNNKRIGELRKLILELIKLYDRENNKDPPLSMVRVVDIVVHNNGKGKSWVILAKPRLVMPKNRKIVKLTLKGGSRNWRHMVKQALRKKGIEPLAKLVDSQQEQVIQALRTK